MVLGDKTQVRKPKVSKEYYLRTLSGKARYLSLSKLLPADWRAVKLSMVSLENGVCVLRLEQIK